MPASRVAPILSARASPHAGHRQRPTNPDCDAAPTPEFLAKADVESMDLSLIDSALSGVALRVRKPPTWSEATLQKYVTPRQAAAAEELRRLAAAANRPPAIRGQSFGDRIDPGFRYAAPPVSSSKANADLTTIRGLFAHDRIALALIDRVVLGDEAPEAVARSGVAHRIGWMSAQRLNVYVNGALRNLLSIIADELHIPPERAA